MQGGRAERGPIRGGRSGGSRAEGFEPEGFGRGFRSEEREPRGPSKGGRAKAGDRSSTRETSRRLWCPMTGALACGGPEWQSLHTLTDTDQQPRAKKYAREQANNPTSKNVSSAERRRERLDRADWQMMEHSDDLQENMQASMQAMSNIHTRKQMPNNMQVGVAEDQSDRRPRAVEDRRGQEPMARGSERQRTKSGRRSEQSETNAATQS